MCCRCKREETWSFYSARDHSEITQIPYAPRGLSHVSHSPYRSTVSPTWNTTTRLRNATASHPRRQASPLTFSLNSSSATSCAMASSHSMTLFGG